MKIAEALLCVNQVQCNHCEGFGNVFKTGPLDLDDNQMEKCSVCAGDGDYECGEIVLQGTLSCPSCTGTTFLLLEAVFTKKNPPYIETHPKDQPGTKPHLFRNRN